MVQSFGAAGPPGLRRGDTPADRPAPSGPIIGIVILLAVMCARRALT
jgi:hypothetical protein